ncbi:hypothetical protein X848_gp21 [Edwardsiella phage PEi21]|uniref:Uncharacterized protein n=1 Tax=Edwardsiella phage PEi21 TaxID=1325372 RepID=N0DP58_9CAUD|nr:hypothetical protein X848_gp21 [Edwardsiella phage PEi21]BAN16831.1 hypothetical protein [Edwardsiella phage PEi21]
MKIVSVVFTLCVAIDLGSTPYRWFDIKYTSFICQMYN